jgi:hypothetical protein
VCIWLPCRHLPSFTLSSCLYPFSSTFETCCVGNALTPSCAFASRREPGWLLRTVSVCEYPEQTELRRMCSEATAPVSGETCGIPITCARSVMGGGGSGRFCLYTVDTNRAPWRVSFHRVQRSGAYKHIRLLHLCYGTPPHRASCHFVDTPRASLFACRCRQGGGGDVLCVGEGAIDCHYRVSRPARLVRSAHFMCGAHVQPRRR